MSVTFNSTTQHLWATLLNNGMSITGAAGMMGNIYAESNCCPERVQGDYSSGYSNSKAYTEQVDKKIISEYDFVHNGPGGGGYGLCQWTYYTRKQNLYDNTVKQNISIGNLDAQVKFLIAELKTTRYNTRDEGVEGTTVWDVVKSTASNTVAQCSNAILLNFEKPANMESKKNQRANYSQEYFDKYATSSPNYQNYLKVNNLNSLVDIALSEARLEVAESPPGSNSVKYNTWYYGRPVSGSGYPWCMAFVQWCLNQAGITAYKTASCTDFMNHYSAYSVDRQKLIPGDIVLFSKTSKIGRAHV